MPVAGPHPSPSSPGPVRPGPGSHATLRPAESAEVTGGFWHERRTVNAEAAIPQGPQLLESAGNLHNLRLAAGTATGEYRGDLPFLDSDVHKWLEAASWQLAASEGKDEKLGAAVDELIALLADAQQENGYLDSWFQVVHPDQRFTDLRWGHELYCAGHLIQAAVAHHRATGRTDLLAIARAFADHIDSVFGQGKQVDGVCGHPEIETALVELYRETGERRYLDLAAYFVDRRGHGLLAGTSGRGGGPGLAYFQDRVPVREAANVEGHAVRQLYLLAGAADVATETGEEELRAAVERLWTAMTATKTHLTGGLGAHHAWEDFGDPYELPNERAYCETCAAIASVQFSWRMALLTGEARYSDLVERTLYNGFLAGMSLDGESWLYVNPLQVRDGYVDQGGDHASRRTKWFRCACCPPNAMRLLASLPHYLVSCDATGLQVHQYATGRYRGGDLAVAVETRYPWEGRIAVTVEEAPGGAERTLALRVPHWCASTTVTIDGEQVAQAAEDGWLRLRRAWHPGQTVVLDLALDPRLTAGDPRVDAVRGCVAIERGPLVYCLEQADNPGGGLDDVVLDTTAPLAPTARPDLLGGVTAVVAAGHRRDLSGTPWWPYRSAAPGTPDEDSGARSGEPVELTAVPYYAWANREDGSMRVWLPTD